ncbi:MAG: hypothetical protein ACLP1X_33755 [Polyangiaceae bacterium]
MSTVLTDIRRCIECGSSYSPDEEMDASPSYVYAPHLYWQGAQDYCLACWLGVGPLDEVDHVEESDMNREH